ncbi:MAG: hypothetical protein J0L55_13875 [Caulobacterales bacterium]|nr:hypothetical protein [Caulobacterales bacterium]
MNNHKGYYGGIGIKAFIQNDVPIFVFGDGTIFWGDKKFEALESGAIDAQICSNSGNLIILGDDGSLKKISPKGAINKLNNIDFGFADCLIANKKRGIFAISASRKVFVIKSTGETLFEFTPPMSPNAINFDLAGENLVVGYGNGLVIYDLKSNEPPIELKAQGGVIAASFSPDLCFLVAATGEPALIGWRLHDGVAFRMAGYPAKPTSFAWFNEGKSLVTSGGPVGVVWPFTGSEGPMGTRAETYRTRNSIVSAVNCAAKNLVLGYLDGGLDLIDLETGNHAFLAGEKPQIEGQIDLRNGSGQIISIAISTNGRFIAWIAENGHFGSLRV